MPPPSASFCGLSVAFAFLTSNSVSAMTGLDGIETFSDGISV